ncbi:MAG: GMP/IMP nucleotidase [Gammaproteobacteria bacterium]|nr:MAG: GMP/IMP nucleotidase [Gammaproteobacteria bacterium]
MDGTLLDLNYDNHFWQEYVPRRYGEKYGLSLESAKQELVPRFRKAEGTLEWYCVDYWSAQLGLDIPVLKEEINHLIAVHPHVVEFLEAVNAIDKRIVLVTNAHGKSLKIKMKHTRLGNFFNNIVCSHDLGLPKEAEGFWQKFQQTEPFDKKHTLLVDDSLAVLRAAMQYGINHLLAIKKPDSQLEKRPMQEFDAIENFKEIMPDNPGLSIENHKM